MESVASQWSDHRVSADDIFKSIQSFTQMESHDFGVDAIKKERIAELKSPIECGVITD